MAAIVAMGHKKETILETTAVVVTTRQEGLERMG